MLFERRVYIGCSPALRCLNPYSNGICSLRRGKTSFVPCLSTRLNPYSNGICSLSIPLVWSFVTNMSLNPYSNGICSLSQMNDKQKAKYAES